jgi:hypothetical protein
MVSGAQNVTVVNYEMRFEIHLRFEVRRSQSIFAITDPVKILIRLSSSNPHVEMRCAASTAWAIILVDEELPQLRTIEDSTFWDRRAARVCRGCQGVAIRAIAASIFPSCVAKMDTTRVSDGARALWRVVVCCSIAGNVWTIAVRPPIEGEDPDSCIEAALARLE